MGVLLYALLCGYLPFDDDNINVLYKKIQTGKYELPAWLSQDSINLLNDLLQTDPKRRISMQQLVEHPWVLKGYSARVDWETRYFFKDLDRECLAEIALYFNKPLKEINDHIKIWNYDFLTATYYLLVFMKMQGRQPKIKANMKKYSQFITFANCTITNSTTLASTLPLPAVSGSLSLNAQLNQNRILVERQLASLTVSSGTPKVATPIIKSAAIGGTMNSANVKIITSKPPQHVNNNYDKQNSENCQQIAQTTPHVKAAQPVATATSNSQKPKHLHFDELKVSDKPTKKRDAKPVSSKVIQSANPPITTVSTSLAKPIELSPSSSTNSSESSSSSSSSSSESLSAASSYSMTSSNTNDLTNFALPTRAARNRNK
jgi:serine/threonine protein kinase